MVCKDSLNIHFCKNFRTLLDLTGSDSPNGNFPAGKLELALQMILLNIGCKEALNNILRG